jgi:hypothetical protein|tara:strand:- start:42 stop:563 length:522 start_codon:yes stop_codon:yes gene_type:complete
MVRSKESTGDVGIVFDDDDDDISGVNVSRTKGVSSPSSFVSLIITFDDTIFFVGIGLDLFFVAETTVAIKIAFASKHFNGVGVIDTLLDKSGLAGKTISLSSLFNAFRTNPNGFFGATSSKSIKWFWYDVEGVVVVVPPLLLKTNRSRAELCNGASSTRASTIGRMIFLRSLY